MPVTRRSLIRTSLIAARLLFGEVAAPLPALAEIDGRTLEPGTSA